MEQQIKSVYNKKRQTKDVRRKCLDRGSLGRIKVVLQNEKTVTFTTF